MPPSIAAMLPISHSVCALLAAAFLMLGPSITGAHVCRLALLTGVWFVSAAEALRVVAANSATPIGRGEAPVHGNMRSRATCVHGNMQFQIPVSPERRKVARHSLRKAACALYWCEPTFSVGNDSSATRTRKNTPSRFGSRIGLACLCRRAFFGDGPKLSAFLNDVILQALLSNWR